MKQTGTEIHIWMGLKPPIYQGLRVIPMMGPPAQFKPGFKADNDETKEKK